MGSQYCAIAVSSFLYPCYVKMFQCNEFFVLSNESICDVELRIGDNVYKEYKLKITKSCLYKITGLVRILLKHFCGINIDNIEEVI